jgi:hypothetical protein
VSDKIEMGMKANITKVDCMFLLCSTPWAAWQLLFLEVVCILCAMLRLLPPHQPSCCSSKVLSMSTQSYLLHPVAHLVHATSYHIYTLFESIDLNISLTCARFKKLTLWGYWLLHFPPTRTCSKGPPTETNSLQPYRLQGINVMRVSCTIHFSGCL